MADVYIPGDDWAALNRSANCFFPALLTASQSEDGFNINELFTEARAGGSGISEQALGKVVRLEAVTHETARLAADALLIHDKRVGKVKPRDFDPSHIVGGFFSIPALQEAMDARATTLLRLSDLSQVSEDAIAHALGGGRVTGGIAVALFGALGGAEDSSSLRRFAPSRANRRSTNRTIADAPFTLNDLQLALPAEAANPWLWPPGERR